MECSSSEHGKWFTQTLPGRATLINFSEPRFPHFIEVGMAVVLVSQVCHEGQGDDWHTIRGSINVTCYYDTVATIYSL